MGRFDAVSERPRRRGQAVLVGRAPGDPNGHIRITLGDDFRVEGGDEMSHGRLQQCARRIRSEIERRGLCMRDITRDQYEEIVRLVEECCAG